MLGQEQSKGAKQKEVKQRHPGFVVSNEAAVTPGRTAKPQEVIISPAVKQLNKDGYIVYNTAEKQDIYISIQPDSAFFDEEEPRMVRMAGGSFVSGNKHSDPVEMHIKPEPEPEQMTFNQPADIFANASRREEQEEIDFNEIIIKKNNNFEVEIELPPTFFKPVFEERYEPIIEESFRMEARPEMAKTSSAAVKTEYIEVPIIQYKDIPEYEVLDTGLRPAKRETPKAAASGGYREVLGYETQTAPVEKLPVQKAPAHKAPIVEVQIEKAPVVSTPVEKAPIAEVFIEKAPIAEAQIEKVPVAEVLFEKAPIAEVPAGLYLDGRRPTDDAKADAETAVELSSFIETSMEAEMAVTSVSAPIEKVEVSPAPPVECIDIVVTAPQVEEAETPVTEEAQAIEETACEEKIPEISETVTGEPAALEITDPVADIMKLTIPGLHMSEDLMSELAQNWERTIPEDGLEAYDCKFKMLMKAQVKEEIVPCAASFAFEGRESVIRHDSSIDYRH